MAANRCEKCKHFLGRHGVAGCKDCYCPAKGAK